MDIFLISNHQGGVALSAIGKMISRDFWQPTSKLNGPGYFYGRTDSGKTWAMITLAELYHTKFKYKIFDIGAGKRNENTFWCFKSEEKRLWALFEEEVGEMICKGPKEYKVKLLIPCFSMKLPNKLPQSLPRIQTEVFTIPFKTITIEDISLIIGEVSKNAIYLWNKILKDLPNNASALEIDYYINTKMSKFKSLAIYRLFLKPAIDNNLISGSTCSLNLDLISEAKEKDRISVLCHDYIPGKLWQMFIMGYIKRNILFELAMHDKIPKNNIGLFREAGDYMKKVDRDLESGEQVQIFRNLLTKIVRYGRSGFPLFLDTQSPCLTGNTEIRIKGNKKIKIKDLLEKFYTKSYNFKTKEYQFKPAKRITVGERDVYEITLEDGKKVKATSNHRFFNKKLKKIFVRDLNIGDDILIEKKDISKIHIKNLKKASKKNRQKRSKALKKYSKEVGVSEEARFNMSISQTGKKNGFYRRKHSIITKNKIKKSLKKSGHLEKASERMKKYNPMFKKEIKLKMTKTRKQQWKNNIQYKKNYINALNRVKPNKKEQIINNIILNLNLNFIYVGNGIKWITAENNARFNPDFISENSNKIIEFDGNYWHKKRVERDILRNKTYKLRGYDLLILRDEDLTNNDILNNKIKEFAKC